MYIYIYIYIYLSVCIFLYMCMYVCICVYMFPRTCLYVYVYVYMYIYIYVFKYKLLILFSFFSLSFVLISFIISDHFLLFRSGFCIFYRSVSFRSVVCYSDHFFAIHKRFVHNLQFKHSKYGENDNEKIFLSQCKINIMFLH